MVVHQFDSNNRLVIWHHNRMSTDKFDKYSIGLLAKKMIEDFDRLGVKMIIPVPKAHLDLLKNYYPKSENIDYVEVDVSYLGSCLQIRDFKEMQKRTDYKTILNLEPFNQEQVSAALSKPAAYFKPKIVNYVLFSPDEDMLGEVEKRRIVLSILDSCAVFNGPVSMDQMLGIARGFVSPSFIREKQNKNWKYVTLGINCKKLDELRVPREKDGKLRFLYGGRLTGHKHVEDTILAVEEIYNKGTDVEYVIQTYGRGSNAKLKEWAEKYPFVKPIYDAPQSDFYKNAFKSDVFICASRVETFGLSFFEMMYAGMIGIFYRQKWQKGILPTGRGAPVNYPFECVDMDTMKKCAMYVANDLERARAQVDYVPGWIAENENSDKKNVELLEKIQKFSEEKS